MFGQETIPIPYLREFWTHALQGRSSGKSWVLDNTLLSGLRLGLQETFAFVQMARPSLADFERWVLEKNSGTIEMERVERINAALRGELTTQSAVEPVLTPSDLSFWDAHGYVVLRQAVTAEAAGRAAAAIYEFVGARADDPETWYGGPSMGRSIWVPLLHHPALLENRSSARIHAAFAQLWKRSDLWANTDQTGFNPPERSGWTFPGQRLHWDVSLVPPVPFGTQAMLYLTDTPLNQGAFQCVPGFHRRIDSWLNALPPDFDPRTVDLSRDAVLVPGSAGDMVIWHHALPHGASPNRGALPRVTQYVNMRPSDWECADVWR